MKSTSSVQARPFHLLDGHAAAALRAHLLAGLQGWTADWVPMLELSADLEIVPAAVRPPAERFEQWETAEGRVWIRDSDADRKAFLASIFGNHFVDDLGRPADAWLADVGRDAWDDRNRLLCKTLIGLSRPRRWPDVDPALYRPGSGAVAMGCAAIGLFLLADAGVLRHVPPADRQTSAHSVPLEPLEAALQSEDVAVSVSLGTVDLALESLLDLHPGDVLRLPTRLDDPLLLTCGQRTVGRGALGEHKGKLALQLLN